MTRIAPGTLVGIALVVYAVANLAHEGLGHGLACVVLGGQPVQLNAIFFECRDAGLSAPALRALSASGTLVNLALALVAGLGLRARPRAPATRYALWLAMTVNLLQGTGYLLFSGVASIGDWAAVVNGLAPHAAWRALLVVAGAAGYTATIWLALVTLRPMAGGRAAAWRLTLVPYVLGAMLYIAAGLFNPYGLKLVLISAAAASLGGTSALGWMASMVRDAPGAPGAPGVCDLPPSRAWTVAGVATAATFVAVVGPGIRF